MVDEDFGDDIPMGTGNALYIIDMQSGDILQRIRMPNLPGDVSTICLDGDEIFILIAGLDTSEVVVLRYAGSEA